MPNVWSFQDPETTAVITTQRILSRERPILYVTHDEDDGMWQFLDGDPVSEEEAAIVSLGEIVGRDSSLSQLADLPLGWTAWRDSGDGDWQRKKWEAES
ncbi:hypothetical protein J19TS2_49270 [Cohnella xylanilytica]|uniref:hypothetical protein n=1 Tax=Cohnella xylanilytica TaxID=557555 RepID=UPI001B0C4B9A|nr:hypothetical protein [Cohnella xylanilytica]GIO15372.1 hypothetical protein J19TS2_49270 [Cohnella xylanilytica]